jgi:hypothetical protein
MSAQVERQLVSSGGNSVNVPGYNVSYSIGEPISGRRESGSVFLLQGFEQPDQQVIVLPVTWLTFTAEAIGKNNLLNWRVALTGREADFTIERSTDGFTFTTLSILPINNSVLNEAEYSWTDIDFPPTLLYYRIRQTDQDGAETVSPMRIIDRRGEGQTALLLYPNPAFGSVNWSLRGADENVGSELRLFDATGRQVQVFRLQGGSGLLPLGSLPPGSYNFLCIPRAGAQNNAHKSTQNRGLLIIR